MLEFARQILAWDYTVFQFINQGLANPVTDFIMPLVTTDLNLKIFYAFCIFLLVWKGDRRLRYAIIFSLITIAATDLINSAVLKPLFERPRPCHSFTVHLLVPCGAGLSFPSSHAANLFGQAFLFRIIKPSLTKYLIPLAIIVALSRVFVGVHYPLDILVGAAVGIIIGHAVALLYLKLIPRMAPLEAKEVGHGG
jgi:membrane-associated phospholipid phosphatase